MDSLNPARPLNVLISGGGIAGQSLALWLARAGHHATIVERFPALRDEGAQVDLRGQGIDAARAMGIFDEISAHLVDEPGLTFVNSRGKRRGTIMANTSGKGKQSLTSEYEIMRGDIVRILYDATKDHPGIDYVFDTSVDRFDQNADHVTAHFSNGTTGDYDLLVGADGQGSRIRQAILPGDEDPYLRLGLHVAYWLLPRTDRDGDIRETFHAPGGRMIWRRSHTPAESQAYFVLRETSPEASAVHRKTTEEQKMFWDARFRDAGWQASRFITGMEDTSNFYSQEIVQVKTNTWSKGRVVLLGDAAHCASPFSGMGVSGALVGAYVLAGEISRSAQDLPTALAAYDRVLRPFVDTIQAGVKPRTLQLGIPKSRVGVALLHAATTLAAALRIPSLIERFAKEDRGGDWQLPHYPAFSKDVIESGRP